MLVVVPLHERVYPGPCGRDIHERMYGVIRPILEGFEQRFGVRIVVADRRVSKLAMPPSVIIVANIVEPFIGLPLSECRTIWPGSIYQGRPVAQDCSRWAVPAMIQEFAPHRW